MPEAEPLALHLHTLDSLVADLISGRPVLTASGQAFALPDDRTRSALEWYRKRGAPAWTANVSAQHGEELVDAILRTPPELPGRALRRDASSRRCLRLKRLKAHRFAGLHKYGVPGNPPPDYTHEFSEDVTLFEGRNGSGKTSLLNAIIWALTGELLRPQREPETAEDFDIRLRLSEEGGNESSHRLSPLTPMPHADQFQPTDSWVPADTSVELVFEDESGMELPPITRTQSRTTQGKLKETGSDLSVLGIDPISLRLGTVMPGLLPLIKVGSESELGRAVSQLTGLSALSDLADHARRARTKIDKEYVKAKSADRDRSDGDYITAKSDLDAAIVEHPNLAPPIGVPVPSDDPTIESHLREIRNHFETTKVDSFRSAGEILGGDFDPTKVAVLADIERNSARALERVSKPQELASARRLDALRQLNDGQLTLATTKIQGILREAKILDDLARTPSAAARARLYARVASWMSEHPGMSGDECACVVCGGNLENSRDPVTGQPVRAHLHEAAADAEVMSKTLGQWEVSAHRDLVASLPEALGDAIQNDLPDHPCDLIRQALVDELFAHDPFSGVLKGLRDQAAATFDRIAKDRPALDAPIAIVLPPNCSKLATIVGRLDKAIRFSRWRHANDVLAKTIFLEVVGRPQKEGRSPETTTLTGKLIVLNGTVRAAKPVSDALMLCARIEKCMQTRRATEKRLKDYATASAALVNLERVGELADEQVNELRSRLRHDAAAWRERIYLGAYPGTALRFVDATMGRKGELDLLVEAGGVAAPAQHVSNASALRATLVAFYLAFWEFVYRERGGLSLLVFDDPQELLDDENRERLSAALKILVARGAQVVVTSYDPRFCSHVSRLDLPRGLARYVVHPATRQQPTIRVSQPLPDVLSYKAAFDADENDEVSAMRFTEACRVFFEARLGDMMDEPGYNAWAIANPDPTLATFVQRLRTLVKAGPSGMFSAHVFKRFVDHPALADGSPVLALMNKAHHGRRQEIRAADVARCANELSELLEIVEQMDEEAYRWRRRDEVKPLQIVSAPVALTPPPLPRLDIAICPDLAAFTGDATVGESQSALEVLDPKILDGVVAFYLRRPNFAFAAPQGSLALAEAVPGPVADRRLVIARHGKAVYARRLVRSLSSTLVGLTAEVPDPRTRSPRTVLLPEAEVELHQVIGIVFDHKISIGPGEEEAVVVDAGDSLKRVEIAFRVVEDSAVPLALRKQIVLGGAKLNLANLGQHEDSLVALALDDGSSLFKRIGPALPGPLAHLRKFESIGGLGSSQILAIEKPQEGIRTLVGARSIIGVLYNA